MSKFFASFYIQAFSNTTPQILHRALWLSPVRTMQWETKVSILNLDFKKSHATHPLSFSILTHHGWHEWQGDVLNKAISTLWPELKVRQVSVLPIVEKPPSQISSLHVPMSDPVSWPGWYKTTAISRCLLPRLIYDLLVLVMLSKWQLDCGSHIPGFGWIFFACLEI